MYICQSGALFLTAYIFDSCLTQGWVANEKMTYITDYQHCPYWNLLSDFEGE